MNWPTLEVADILRASRSSFLDLHGSHLAPQHRKVMDAIVRCRTAALGGHLHRCSGCGHQAISYNSCRNRHCPKCQGNARAKWLAARSAELLPVPYFHLVFTVPHELSALMLQNKRLLYDLLFRSSAATLLEVARDPKHMGADIGLLSVLHTWGQNLQHHPHIHCVVPGGGLALDGTRWVAASSRFFLPVRVLSRVFRGKFIAELKQLSLQDKLQFHGSLKELATPDRFQRFLRQLFTKDWVVYAKPPFGGAEHVLNYLARYTHRVAISNHRLVAFKDDRVSFRWKDYAAGSKQKIMTVAADEFLRRFLIHVLFKDSFASGTSDFSLTVNGPHLCCVAACCLHRRCAITTARAHSSDQVPACSQPMLVQVSTDHQLSAAGSSTISPSKPSLDSS